MEEKEYIKTLINDKNIKGIFQYGDRLNRAGIKDTSLPYEYILVLDDIEKFDFSNICFLKNSILENTKEVNGQLIHIFINGEYCKYIFKLRENFDYEKEYNMNSLIELIYDRDGAYGDNLVSNDIKDRLKKPGEEDFKTLVLDFFTLIYDSSKAMENNQIYRSQILFEEGRRLLLDMVEYYIGSEYDFLINLGNRGKNIRAYLDKEIYDKLVESTSSSDMEKMWTSIFNSASIFRKLGLEVSNVLEYEYPKKTDVEILRYLRKAFNRSRGLGE